VGRSPGQAILGLPLNVILWKEKPERPSLELE
jgi:hypothetical protein